MNADSKIVEHLNRTLRSELTAVSQYWFHYMLPEDWGPVHIARKNRDESSDEMSFADSLIERIVFLDGHPNLPTPDPVRLGQTPKERLECDLVAEQEARIICKQAREYCHKNGDHLSKGLLDERSKDNKAQTDFLETQLDLLGKTGSQNNDHH